jgi:hypothetical protein
MVNGTNWWLRNAAGQRTQWTSTYNSYLVNQSQWNTKNSAGQTWPQYKAKYDSDNLYSGVKGWDYLFMDNVFGKPRVDADWMRNGTNQSQNDPTIQAASRQGYVNYFTAFRSLAPGVKIMGNNDSDLTSHEFYQQMEGSFIECNFGKSWSIETWGGWSQAMDWYRKHLANTRAPHDVIMQVCQPSVNYSDMRYGLASTMLEDGYFAYQVGGNNTVAPVWFDEYSAPIGSPSEAPPKAPTSSGIWVRHYSNGIVLVNPSTTTTLTIDIGTGYKHIKGTQDPNVNNGLSERSISMPPRSGLLMLKG